MIKLIEKHTTMFGISKSTLIVSVSADYTKDGEDKFYLYDINF